MEKTIDAKSLENNEKITGHSNTAPQNIAGGQKKLPMKALSHAKALEAAALTLESEARSLRRQADNLKKRAASKERTKALRDVWKRVIADTDNGIPEKTARVMAAAALNVDIETVDYWMQRAAIQSAAFRMWRRDRQLFRIAHTRSNRELADLFNIHEKTVSKIIQRQLKSRYRA